MAVQVAQFEKLARCYVAQGEAQHGLARRLAAELDSRGTLDVLRRGVKDHGVLIRLAYFGPTHSITPQLRYSPTTDDELDLGLYASAHQEFAP